MEIARENGVHENAILYWLSKHGITRRTMAQTRHLKHWGACGEDNPMHGKRGSLSVNWKGGHTPERQRDYAKNEVVAFLKAIRIRDKVCRKCGTKSRLHVHHIKSFSDYKELRYDDKNCVALCGTCHRWVHSRQNKKGLFL